MKKVFTIILVSIISIKCSYSQLTIDSTVTSAAMVNAITAGGIAVSNISYTGAQLARGTFLCTGNCNIGISGGIILTSGWVSIAASPNIGTGQGADVGLGGDPDLDNLTTGPTYDASVLEFDFIALSDTAVFNYVFASDEYSDYVGSSFNDVFGFFIGGPGISGLQNIALIPGTTTPIAINNVNNGNSGGIPTGPCNNCVYFYDNVIDTFTTAYDGLTTSLTATAANIQPGQTYHLKLAISDVADHIFDSGVFLEAGSFRIAGPPAMYVGGTRLIGNTVHICQGSSVSLSVPEGFSYLWSTGETTASIEVSIAGSYSVVITGTNTNYPVTSPAIIFIVDATTIPTPVLSQNNNVISSSVNGSVYNYSWTYNGTPLTGANTPDILVTQPGCYAVTIQDPGGCFVTSDSLCWIPLAVNELNSGNNINLYPNPFTQNATLTFDNPAKSIFTLSIFDITGRELRRIENIRSNSVVIEKENLRPGIYFFELKAEKGNEIYKGKMVIN